MLFRSFILFLFLLIEPVVSHGQLLNLYERVTDPRAIARLSGPDTARTKSVCFHGDPAWMGTDTLDRYGLIAEDTGSGIITHVWSTGAVADTACTVKLYIDDTLRFKDTYNALFRGGSHGVLCPPLDTLANGATTWDLQIPFHHGFKFTALTSNPNLYFCTEWHAAPQGTVPSLDITSANAPQPQLRYAEVALVRPSSPWNGPFAASLARLDTLRPRNSLSVAEIDGPKMLEILRFQPASYEFADLDSTWLNIYWDHSPTPSVHVPLKDFFLSPVAVTSVRSFQLKADRDSGFVCYFPMPFRDHASIELVRNGSTPLAIRTMIQCNPESIDRNVYGYFHADFHESNPTQYHIYHPVIHTVGRGRYIGMGFGVMAQPYAVFLEGAPIFNVDSVQEFQTLYTGGEDYFDGGWWFPNGPFTLPFAGYTHFIDQFYRFHYLDCYEFYSSFDMDLKPGRNLDVYDHYRTVGYYYQHWTPFWASRDTIIAGENWTVDGAGYGNKQSLVLTLSRSGASDTILLQTTTDVSGRFHLSLQVPPSWKPGVYTLSVKGETSPNKFFVLGKPAIRPVVDYHPIVLRAGDSLLVIGTGFVPGEHVSFYLDSIPLSQSTVADSASEIRLTLRMPYLADHAYLLVARGDRSGNSTAEERVSLTRTLNFEFEDLMPPTYKTPGQCYAEDVAYFWEAQWSKQMFVYFKPDTVFSGATLEFAFRLSHPDTFAIEFHHSTSRDLGEYAVIIDGEAVGQIGDGHPDPDLDPLPSGPIPLGVHFLDSGLHHIRFTCTGKADTAKNYWLEPDNLILRPTTTLAPAPGTLHRTDLHNSSPPRAVQIFPNPTHNRSAMITFSLGEVDTPLRNGKVVARLDDEVGRTYSIQLTGSLIDGGFTGSCSLVGVPPGTFFVSLVVAGETGEVIQLPMVPLVVE